MPAMSKPHALTNSNLIDHCHALDILAHRLHLTSACHISVKSPCLMFRQGIACCRSGQTKSLSNSETLYCLSIVSTLLWCAGIDLAAFPRPTGDAAEGAVAAPAPLFPANAHPRYLRLTCNAIPAQQVSPMYILLLARAAS